MKHLAFIAIACLGFVVSANAQGNAVGIWLSATVSATVSTGSPSGPIVKESLTTAKYLEEGIRRINNGDSNKANYFVGLRAINGQVAVVHRPSKTVAYSISSAPNTLGFAGNGGNTQGLLAGTSTVSSLNTDMAGLAVDRVTNSNGALKSVTRTFSGGAGSRVITGSVRTGAKRESL